VETIAPEHPIARGLPRSFTLLDESYWWPTPPLDPSRATVLAVSHEKRPEEAGEAHPQPIFWIAGSGRGRVFGCVAGHFVWTFDDPWLRLWLLRGIAWSAGEPPYRFDPLALRGARVR
jgi:type 1 glutamine amidotransferase